MAERSFGGYSYQQRLGVAVFGEVYRALSGTGKEARLIHVAPQLARQPAFARALVRFGEQTVPLEHPRVVGVRQVGRSGENLVVVTDPVSGPVALRDLLARSGGRLPADIALAIGLGAVEGLAHAHSLRVVHGAVHPRSVLIDFHGGVKLADFGLAWALVETAAESDEAGLLRGLRGYLAPELALHQSATEASDVYAAGALLFDLVHGEPPPGELRAPPNLGRVIGRALATDPEVRLINASELEELLEEAIAADGSRVAPAEEVAHFVTERLAASDDALHTATDDLVAELAAADLSAPPAERSGLAPERSGRVTDVLARLEEEAGNEADEPPGDMTEVDPQSGLRGEPDLSDILHVGDAQAVSPSGRAAPARSARSAKSAEEDESTPLPTPVPHRPGSVTRHLGELQAEDAAIRRRRRSGGLAGSPDDMAALLASPRRPRVLVWMGVIAFAVAALVAILYTQTDLFDPGRKQAEERAAEIDRKEAVARHEAAQPSPAEVTITATEPDAAVWLLLGRTPLDSLPLSGAMVHELRVEHEGYLSLDVRVTGYQWKEVGGALRAEVEAALTPGKPQVPVPAFPAVGEGSPPPGPRGRGVVHVQSTPAGAQVWLLIGFTPRATITGLEAGRGYEVKVLKDGFRPGFTAVRAEEWYLSGPGGPMLASLSREVTLSPRVERRPGKLRKRGRGSQAAGERR